MLAGALLAGMGSIDAAAQLAATVLRVPETPPGKVLYSMHNDTFTVRVRVPGGEWQDLYEYKVMVDLDDPQPASMVMFDAAGPVEVAVKKNNGDVRRVEVRPSARGVEAALHGNTAFFTLNGPARLSVEFDGDRLHNLHLFANPVRSDVPPPASPDTVYFGPGLHVADGDGRFRIASGKTVYLATGAILQGQIDISNAQDVRVIGNGLIIDASEGFSILHSRNVTIDGPVIVNPKHYSVMCGQSSGVTLRNLKAFSAGGWTDGIDMMSCSDVTINGVFLRNSDDNIAIYGHRWDYRGDARNITVTDAILWADVAHPINIGLHGNADAPELVENIVFRNIDILGHDEDDRNYQGALAISNSDNNLVRNVLFEDVRVDSIEEGMLFNFRVVYNEKYSKAPGRGIENITLRNVTVTGGDINRSLITGYARDRMVRGVQIENVRVGGKALRREDIAVGPFVEGLTVKP